MMANEKRLIDANALKRHMIKAMELSRVQTITQDDFVYCIDNSDTVDAVEVVWCKDCTYWKKATANKKGFLICPASGMEIMAHDFCSYGEKRDNERKAD